MHWHCSVPCQHACGSRATIGSCTLAPFDTLAYSCQIVSCLTSCTRRVHTSPMGSVLSIRMAAHRQAVTMRNGMTTRLSRRRRRCRGKHHSDQLSPCSMCCDSHPQLPTRKPIDQCAQDPVRLSGIRAEAGLGGGPLAAELRAAAAAPPGAAAGSAGEAHSSPGLHSCQPAGHPVSARVRVESSAGNRNQYSVASHSTLTPSCPLLEFACASQMSRSKELREDASGQLTYVVAPAVPCWTCLMRTGACPGRRWG